MVLLIEMYKFAIKYCYYEEAFQTPVFTISIIPHGGM